MKIPKSISGKDELINLLAGGLTSTGRRHIRFVYGSSIIPAVIGLAISAAGTGLSMSAASSEQDAMNKSVSDSLQQLQELQKKSTPIVQGQEQKSTVGSANQDIKAGQQKALGDYVMAQAAPFGGENSGSKESSNITSAGTRGKESANTQASANLEGYSNLGQQWQLSDAAARDLLGNIGAQGASIGSAVPANLAVARNSQATEAGIGSLASTVGGLGATYAAQKGAFNSATPSTNGIVPGGPGSAQFLVNDGSEVNPYNYQLPAANWASTP